MKVNFMIIGAQKCGTTSLFRTLCQHPQVVGSAEKETNYFITTEDWRRDLARYHALFQQREGAIYGEASPSYTFFPLRKLGIWNDLYEYNPELKLIYLVRNPIDRIVSNYMHSYERGYTDLPIDDVVRQSRFYTDVTRYHTQIMPFIRRFGPERVCIIDFDDLVQQREQVLRRLASFLKIDPEGFDYGQSVHSNVSVGGTKSHHRLDQPPLHLRILRRVAPALWRQLTDNSQRRFSRRPELSPETRQMIVDLLALEVAALGELMGTDLSHWLQITPADAATSTSASTKALAPDAAVATTE